MSSKRQRGKLTKWNDERGFGFIQPQDGSQSVFLHRSALPKYIRRPQVGDTILYELETQTDGKVRACHASIEGVIARPASFTSRKDQSRVVMAGLFLTLLVLAVSVRYSGSPSASFSTNPIPQSDSPQPPGFPIKGNISLPSGDKIYHVPGGEDYEATVIDLSRGERWFRTEEEARAHGWRRAPR